MGKTKAPKGAASGGAGAVIFFVGSLLLVAHAVVIAEDVRAVIEDPDKENKPGEVLKLAIDLSRYLPK